MDEQRAQALESLRERIRAVCVHDQTQWDATWKEVLGDLINARRGLLHPNVFFSVLEANSVLLSRPEGHLLLWKFQEPNGAVVATRFLRWIALNAPADHVDPDLLFPEPPQLPQPYRRIQAILNRDIIDAAWKIITTESARFKAGNTGGEDTCSSSTSKRDTNRADRLDQQSNDYDVAKSRSCEPTWQIPLGEGTQRVVGLASHCLLPVVVAAINTDPTEDSVSNTAPSLQIICTANEESKLLGEFRIEYPVDVQPPAGTADATTKIHVSIEKISALQLANDSGGSCLAVHLVETTTIEPTDLDPNSDVKPPPPTIRECVNVYAIRIDTPQAPSDDATAPLEFSCQLVAVIKPPQTPESSVSAIVLSPDSQILALTLVGSALVGLYCLRRDESNQDPLTLTSPTFQVDLKATRSPFSEDECEAIVHFLVAPSTTRAQCSTSPRAAPKTYAFVVCCGFKLLKYVLPSVANTVTNPQSPVLLAPTKSWKHLTKITASAQDITTQYVAVGCWDGTIVVWDVLRDVDYAFLSPFHGTDNKMEPSSKSFGSAFSAEISNIIFCQAAFVVALSKTQQHLYFFDIRERGKPVFTRVVSPPTTLSSSTSTRQPFPHSNVSMTSLALSTVTADIPMALVEYSDGMVMFYDIRIAEAIGSFRMTLLIPTSPSAHLMKSSPVASCGLTSIAGNMEVLAGVVTQSKTPGACVGLFSWRDILLSCFPFFSTMLEQRQEEPTNSTVRQLFTSNCASAGPSASAPLSSIMAPSALADSLESMFLQMAGELPLSPARAKLPTDGGLSPLQSPLGRSSISIIPSNTALSQFAKDDECANAIMLEPVILDDNAFFEQYCREYLDPLVIADKEARLHRKRRELLKVMSAGGAW